MLRHVSISSQFPIANWIREYRFPAPYAKIDIEAENKESSGKALQDNSDGQSVARPRWASTFVGIEERKAQTSARETRGA
jgi:hypothetical protein